MIWTCPVGQFSCKSWLPKPKIDWAIGQPNCRTLNEHSFVLSVLWVCCLSNFFECIMSVLGNFLPEVSHTFARFDFPCSLALPDKRHPNGHILDLQSEKYGLSFDIKKYTTSGCHRLWAAGHRLRAAGHKFAGCGPQIGDCGLRATDCRLRVCGLRVTDCRL